MSFAGSAFSYKTTKARIAETGRTRVYTMLVIGGREGEAVQVSVCPDHGGPQGAKPKAEVIAKILADIKERET